MYFMAVHGDILCLLPQAIQQSKELEISPDLMRVRRVDNPELWVLPPEDKVPQAPVHINSSLRPDVPVFVPGQRYTLPGRTENLALAAPSPFSAHLALVQLRSRDDDEQVPAEAYCPHHPHHSVPVASHLSHLIKGQVPEERRWLKSGLEAHKQIFHSTCKFVKKIMQQAKSKFFNTEICACTSSKQLFHITNTLLGKSKTSSLPYSIPSALLPQRFCDFLVNKISAICDSLSSQTMPLPPVTQFLMDPH